MRLEAKNLSFSYDVKGRQILRQFSLSADSSERVGIIAPSGFGKTTLCRSCPDMKHRKVAKCFLMANHSANMAHTVRYR